MPAAGSGQEDIADSGGEYGAKTKEDREEGEEVLFTMWEVLKEECAVSGHRAAASQPTTRTMPVCIRIEVATS